MFNEAIKALNEQALKAYTHLISIFSKVALVIKTKPYLFHMLVVSVITMSYGCEVLANL